VVTRLDVSASKAKLDRAEVHLASYVAESERLGERTPYRLHVAPVDSETGLFDVFLTHEEFPEASPRATVGDYINNLRSALDYLITAMADASGQSVTRAHQFPVCTKSNDYKEILNGITTNKRCPLYGLQVGLDVVTASQPCNTRPDDPEEDILALLIRFSNTDKHRMLLQEFAMINGRVSLSIEASEGTVVEEWRIPKMEVKVNDTLKIATFRCSHPAARIELNGSVSAQIAIAAPPFPPQYPLGMALRKPDLPEMFDRVSAIVERAAEVEY